MFEFGIFCVILLAVGYWAAMWAIGRRDDAGRAALQRGIAADAARRVQAGPEGRRADLGRSNRPTLCQATNPDQYRPGRWP